MYSPHRACLKSAANEVPYNDAKPTRQGVLQHLDLRPEDLDRRLLKVTTSDKLREDSQLETKVMFMA